MNTDTTAAQPEPIPVNGASCSVHGPCSTGCCDDQPRGDDNGRNHHGWKAALLGALCLAGCLAGPLLAGGLATATGALSGELVAGLAVAALVIGVAVVRRRKAGKPLC